MGLVPRIVLLELQLWCFEHMKLLSTSETLSPSSSLLCTLMGIDSRGHTIIISNTSYWGSFEIFCMAYCYVEIGLHGGAPSNVNPFLQSEVVVSILLYHLNDQRVWILSHFSIKQPV